MLDHLSYSSISNYLACGEAWRRKYVANEPTFTTPALLFGSAIHNTVEEYVQDKSKNLLDLWSGHWNNQVNSEGLPRTDILWGVETAEQHYNEGVRILSNEQVLYNLNTLTPLPENGIERKVELRVPGVPVPVIGYIDIITSDGIPGDFKTSSKSWSSDRAAGEMQPLFYLAALNQAGVKVPEWRFRHFTIVKTKTPKFETFDTMHNPGELFFLFQMIQRVWQAINASVYPINPTGWKCSQQYCDFWANCRGRFQ